MGLRHANQTSFKYDVSKHIQFECLNCHTSFSRLLCEVKKNLARGKKRAYCSQRCADEHRVGQNHHRFKPRIKGICDFCGDTFLSEPWRIKRFCSHNCCNIAAGLKRQKRDSYSFTHKLARKIVNLYQGIKECVECKRTSDLVVHHIDGNQQNNHPSNLQVLCRICHSRYHILNR
jgi:hypothetical protein